MNLEMLCLLLVAILAASLWIPFVIGINTTEFAGKADSFSRPPSLASMAPWVHRAHRAHLNLLEQLLPFAIVVLIAHELGVSTTATGIAAVAFVVLRVVHAIGMISGTARMPLRPLLFTAGWITILVVVWEIFRVAAWT
ncbi:MAG: MAPEG family protein [Pseudomonadota bacterium]